MPDLFTPRLYMSQAERDRYHHILNNLKHMAGPSALGRVQVVAWESMVLSRAVIKILHDKSLLTVDEEDAALLHSALLVLDQAQTPDYKRSAGGRKKRKPQGDQDASSGT